jgi:carboxymethylenebutenolidase
MRDGAKPSSWRLPILGLLATSVACKANANGAASVDGGRDPLVPAEVTYATTPGSLRGFLYRPEGTGPFPAVVFNHGSEQEPGDMRDEAEFYVPRGFVLFAPHRRGQGWSADAGEYINEAWIARGEQPQTLVELLDEQVDDVAAAVAYVRALPDVDATRVALVGCSFGGIETLLAAERDLGLRAAIDFAGAAATWARNPALQARMKRAALGATVPVLFIQAENDFDTAPSRVLSDAMRDAGRPTRLRIFPANGATTLEGHMFCNGSADPRWGPEVLEFLRGAMAPARHGEADASR